VSAGGRPRPTPYGEEVVLFHGPATAVRAVVSAGPHRSSAGLAVAEVPNEGEVAGVGPRLALALAAAAPERQVWASSTAAVLLGGSGVVLHAVGVHDLGDGPPQEVHRVAT
jgi:hypothetical protein